jgi:PPOX class probable F420-dependent enzyme
MIKISPSRLTPRASRLVRAARIAHLATTDAMGQPHVVPICFVVYGKEFYSPIDEKPKQVAPQRLKRLRNVAENPLVSLVIDRYDENWQRLAYVLITGTAKVITQGPRYRNAVHLLRLKYRQYRSMAIDERPMIVIRPRRVICWGAL